MKLASLHSMHRGTGCRIQWLLLTIVPKHLLQLHLCACVCKSSKHTNHSKLLLSKVNPPSDSCSFRVLPWWQAGIQWQKRLMCVRVCVCVFPVCELKGAAAKRRPRWMFFFFFSSGVTPTPQHPVKLRNQQLQVWLASECDILDWGNMNVFLFFFNIQKTLVWHVCVMQRGVILRNKNLV